MSSNLSPYRAEIIAADGSELSGGSIGTILSLDDTKRLDAIGTLEITLPAGEPKLQYITTGTKLAVYDELDGFLGIYLFRSKSIEDNNGQGVCTLQYYDYLKELSQRSVYFNRTYDFDDVSVIIQDILSDLGWSANVTETGTSQITFQGESILRAIDELRDRRGVHYRLNFNKTTQMPVLDFGPFGDLSEVNFEQFNGQIQAEFDRNPNNAIITGASIVVESDEIYNRIIPLGAGQGVSQLTIQLATLGDYVVKYLSNPDFSITSYIEDAASIASYGLRERILSLPNIIPLTNSNTNVTNAKNTLKLTAEAYLRKHLEPRKEYQIDVVGLKQEILPGDKIHVRYIQQKDGITYLSIDDDFWVMEVTRSRDVSGNRAYNFKIANVDQLRTTDQDVIVDVVRDLKSINVHIPATLAYSPIGPYVKRIKGAASPTNRINPTFSARIKEEVLYLNRALMRIAFSPLKSSTTGASAGGGSTETSASGGGATETSTATGLSTGLMIPLGGDHRHDIVAHDHDVVIPAHTHDVTIPSHTHGITYGVFEDTVTPDNIRVNLNGVDITGAINGGNINVGGGDNTYEYDITNLMGISSGAFRRTHEFEFVCTTDTYGEIEFELDLLVTIQPIRVTS